MPGMDMSDNVLASRAGKGDAEAYRQLFEHYQGPVYNFVYRLVDNAEDASDIVQDAFIRMYGVLGQKDIDNFSAYLYRTAKNLAYDEMRRRTRFADVDSEMLAPEDPSIYADPQRALLLGEQMETVRRAARGLNENQRAALILRELEELDYDQMSDILESNRNAVGALLSRARLKFREELRMAQISTEQCPPECEEVIAMLSPYIDGELKADQQEMVESHFEGCTFCMAALDEMREASRSFRMFIPVLPPADMAQAFTGRLQDAAGQTGAAGDVPASPGAAGADGSAGSGGEIGAGSQAGGFSFSRLFRGKTVFAGIVAAALLIPAVGLLAETAGDDGGQPEPLTLTNAASIQTETTASQPAGSVAGATTATGTPPTTNAGVSDASATGASDAGAPGSANGAGGGNAGSGSGSSQPAPPPPAPPTAPEPPPAPPVVVRSGSASPERVIAGNPVAYSAIIEGSAIAVTMDLVSQSDGSTITVPLALKSSGRGTETWTASGYVSRAATYSLIVTATGQGGGSSSLTAGTLVVIPILN